jgi:TPR repeat protein
MSIWGATFVTMSAAGNLGDTHPGQSVLFWQAACDQRRSGACALLESMQSSYCNEGSAWACNEHGIFVAREYDDQADAFKAFNRACDLGFPVGCENARQHDTHANRFASGPPQLSDYPILLQRGKGPVKERDPADLYERACAQGWMSGCASLGRAYQRGDGVSRDPSRAVREFDKACANGWAPACADIGLMYWTAEGVERNEARALEYLGRSCELGLTAGCEQLWRLR